MVKNARILLLILMSWVVGYSTPSFGINNESENFLQSKTDRYLHYVYSKLNFGKHKKLSEEVFCKAYFGYLNMQEEGKLKSNSLLTVCDFSLSSNEKRMWVIDLKTKKILFNTLVAHGQGTGEEFAEKFSNTPDSHQSSLGFYTTGETYEGSNGYSLKLHGEDGIFNSNAYDRAIVIHAAEYVCDSYAKANKRIGRSHGCPALPVDIAPKVIDKIKDGHCLFIYHPSKAYLSHSRWMTSKLRSLPEEADRMDIKLPVNNNPRYIPELAEPSLAEIKAKTPLHESNAEVNSTEENVSKGDKENYRVDVKTIIIKKEDRDRLQDKANSVKELK